MTTLMTSYNPGDVLLIPFPFTNFSTLKQRPCVVISSELFNQNHPDIIVAAITSRIPPIIGSDEYLLNDVEQKAAGLPKPSLVKLGKIVTLDTRLIRKQLGNLPLTTLKDLGLRLRTALIV